MSSSFQIVKKIRDGVVLNLRRIFTGDPLFPYVETIGGDYDFAQTKIVISVNIPNENAFFPALIVDAVTADEIRYLGADDLDETKDNFNVTTADRKFSSLLADVTINVYVVEDPLARDRLVDRIYDHLKLITNDLADLGIEVIKTSIGADRQSFQEDRWFIITPITLKVYTEWVDDVGVAETVSSIPITIDLV